MFGDGSKTTPETFAYFLADHIIKTLGPAVKKILEEHKPPKPTYEVIRQTPQGPVTQQTSLPQALAELTDSIKVQSYFDSELLKVQIELLKETKLLSAELKKNRKLALKLNEDDD